ncbi:hypothetical protein [Lactobacillus crispatus]|jgi:hypothetical protein|uniref:Thioredoxin domain-containing protein n=1 Tax=Lactobacillus crispatus TaxID=47770 RepID=A0ABV2BDH6_9LACO
MIRKIFKRVGMLLLLIIIAISIWLCLAIHRFNQDSKYTFNEAVKNKNTLVIVYKPSCKRCHRVLPRLFLEHCLDRKKEIVINGEKLNDEQRDELENRITPTFRYKNISYNTANISEVEQIWSKSH